MSHELDNLLANEYTRFWLGSSRLPWDWSQDGLSSYHWRSAIGSPCASERWQDHHEHCGGLSDICKLHI